jgi:hypothetical protein
MIWVIPVAVFVFLFVFILILWGWYAKREKYKEGTKEHSERIYRDFEFFIKILVPLIGGLGYIKLTYSASQPALARQAMIGIGALGMFTMFTLAIFIACHQASKIRRWEKVEWETLPFWQEIWMLLCMYSLGVAVWIAAFQW